MTREETAIAEALKDVGDAYLRRYPRPAGATPARDRPQGRRRGIVRFALPAIVGVVAVVAAVTVTLTDRSPSVGPQPFGTERPPRDLEVVATIPVRDSPSVLTSTPDGSVWVGHSVAPVVERIIPTTNEVLSSTEVAGAATLLAGDDVFVYYGAPTSHVISQIPGAPESSPTYAGRAGHLEVDGDSLFFDSFGRRDCPGLGRGSCLHVIRLSTTGLTGNDVVLPVGCCRLSALAADDGRAWIGGGDDEGARLIGIKVDRPQQGRRFGPVELPEAPADLVVHQNSVWAALPRSNSIAVIDMATLEPRFINVAIPIDHLAPEVDHVWGSSADGGVIQVDARTAAVVGRAELDSRLTDVVASDGSAWVAAAEGAVLRIGAP